MQCIIFAALCVVPLYATCLSLGSFQYSNFQYFGDMLCFLASYIKTHLTSKLNKKSLAVACNVGL